MSGMPDGAAQVELWAWSGAAIASVDADAVVHWASPAWIDLFPHTVAWSTRVPDMLPPTDRDRFDVYWSDQVRVQREPLLLTALPGAPDIVHVLTVTSSQASPGLLLMRAESRPANRALRPRSATPVTPLPVSDRELLDRLIEGEKVSGTGSFIVVGDAEHWSPGAWRLIDRDPEEAESVLQFVHPDDFPSTSVWWERVRQRTQLQPIATSMRLLTRTGEERVLRMTGSTRQHSNGQWATSGFVRDVSGDQDIAESVELLRAMRYGEILTRMGSWTRDLPAGLPLFSDQVFEMLGLPVPGPGEDRSFAIENWIHPEDMPAMALELGKSFWEPMIYDVTGRVITVDGGIKYVRAVGETVKLNPDDPQPTRTYGALLDVTDQVIADRAIVTLSRVNRVLAQATDEKTMLEQMCAAAVEAGGYVFAAYDQLVDGTLTRVASAGSDRWIAGEHARRVEQALRQQRAVVLPEDPAAHAADAAAMFAPIRVDDVVDGVLSLWTQDNAAFDVRASSALTDLVDDLGHGISRIRRQAAVNDDFTSAMKVVSVVMEARTFSVAEHHLHVADLAGRVASRMGLDAVTVRRTYLAALVHDLGKVALPAALLMPGARMNFPEEAALLRRHPSIGADLADKFPWSFPLPDIIRQHHEHFDGSGHPFGLAGEAIFVEARVLRAVDAYVSAITRGSRMSSEDAISMLAEGAGSTFDPNVVSALISIFEDGYQFEETPSSVGMLAAAQEDYGSPATCV